MNGALFSNIKQQVLKEWRMKTGRKRNKRKELTLQNWINKDLRKSTKSYRMKPRNDKSISYLKRRRKF